jgi:hypothetical protein
VRGIIIPKNKEVKNNSIAKKRVYQEEDIELK